MSGRARARARGRVRPAQPQDDAAAASAVGLAAGAGAALQPLLGYGAPRPGQQPPQPEPPAEGPLIGRGRQRGGGLPAQGPPKELEISAGFQEMSLGERGGYRRNYNDIGVYTRQSMEHVKEAKTGVSGTAIALSTNHFRLTSRPQWTLYQYHIDFSPPMESRRLRCALLFQHEDILGRTHAFDGTILFLPKKVGNKVTEVYSQTRQGETVKITITLTNELPSTSPTCLQFYNIIFRRVLKIMNLQQIGRNYYNPSDPISVPKHRLMVWPGFTTSILQYETSVMLCSDVSHKVLRSETVLDFMYSLYEQVGEQRFKEACAKELVGLIVLTRYNNKTYRVDDISWDSSPKDRFKKADGSEISFVDYYQMQYNQEVKDLNQPLLLSQPKRKRGPGGAVPGPAALVPELCFLTGLTDKMRSDFSVMKDLAVHTRLAPEQRMREIGKLVDYINKDANVQQELRDWGLSFDSNLLSFSGRVVQSERIHQGGKVFDYNPQAADWSRETRGAPLMRAKPLDNWLLLFPRRNYDAANALVQNLFKVTPAMGIQMKKATMVEVEDRTEAYLRALKQTVTSDTQMVVCLLSSSRKDKYDTIKKFLCSDCPTPSQCVLARTLGKAQTVMAVATKIALQMNCKMGGELWSVEVPLKQLMVVGIDCYHDTSAGRRSIAAFVASLNQGMTRWYSRCVLQDRGQEVVDGLKVCFQAALRTWYTHNQHLPSRIIVYRDGVGDGQLKTLVSYEVPQFLECLKTIGQDYSPKLTVIVVKKRLNNRFFARIDGRLQNPPPGTVVDVEVTRPEWYDFFIVSQSVKCGTVAPTHYNVIYDSSALKPDHMQRLTYKLCHMYYNWPGVIRVPAPCQYAHKLAFLVGQSIHREPNLALAENLYYL
nr:PREDICTED: piwi-like protein 1 [Anolis carolinensis]|eukprot:XP_003227897.2 PREDICTED: piwi-like protein 1 [Anolis carolinensis]